MSITVIKSCGARKSKNRDKDYPYHLLDELLGEDDEGNLFYRYSGEIHKVEVDPQVKVGALFFWDEDKKTLPEFKGVISMVNAIELHDVPTKTGMVTVRLYFITVRPVLLPAGYIDIAQAHYETMKERGRHLKRLVGLVVAVLDVPLPDADAKLPGNFVKGIINLEILRENVPQERRALLWP